MRLLRDVDKRKYRVTAVAPRNHFVFTPLLASTAVGTLEFRNAIEPLRHLTPEIDFFQAECLSIDVHRRVAHCASVFDPRWFVEGYTVSGNNDREDDYDLRRRFDLEFDDIVIGVGAQSGTFGVPGVEEHAYFLKDITDAQKIRQRIISNFELASVRTCSDAQIRTLLHFVIVGGGATGVEFASELADFLRTDVRREFSRIYKYAQVTVLEPTGTLLGNFDRQLSEQAAARFVQRGIDVRSAAVARVTSHSVTLSTGQQVAWGLVVWTAGVVPVPLASDSRRHGLVTAGKQSRILVDPAPPMLSNLSFNLDF